MTVGNAHFLAHNFQFIID